MGGWSCATRVYTHTPVATDIHLSTLRSYIHLSPPGLPALAPYTNPCTPATHTHTDNTASGSHITPSPKARPRQYPDRTVQHPAIYHHAYTHQTHHTHIRASKAKHEHHIHPYSHTHIKERGQQPASSRSPTPYTRSVIISALPRAEGCCLMLQDLIAPSPWYFSALPRADGLEPYQSEQPGLARDCTPPEPSYAPADHTESSTTATECLLPQHTLSIPRHQA
jgi:hypothetical protein